MTRCMRLFVLSHGRPHASTAPGRCRTQGKYAEAELLYKRSLAIYEQAPLRELARLLARQAARKEIIKNLEESEIDHEQA